MHVLYLITRAEMGGSQTHLLDLLRGFKDHFEISLATGEEEFLTEEARKLSIPTHILPNLVQPLNPKRDLKAISELVRLIRRIKPDLIHCHTSKAGVVGRAAALITRTPVVFTAHTWCFADGTSRLWKTVGTPAEQLTAKWTSKIIAVSESNRQLALSRKVAHHSKVVTIHNGIADSPLRARPERKGVPRITMVARFAPQKNQMQLLEALAPIEKPFRLSFVGDGPTMDAARSRAQALGIEDRVEFLGRRRDTDHILADTDIFALATNWEGFPITILEAMRAGLPVVATDVDGVSEAVEHHVTGYLVPKGDTLTLTNRMNELLTSPALRSQLGERARHRFASAFTLDVMLHKLASVYGEIVPHFEYRKEIASLSATA